MLTAEQIEVLCRPWTAEERRMCTCGHPAIDHRKGPCICSCTAFDDSGVALRSCGHLPDDDPCDPDYEPTPTVSARPEGERWVITCPYCGNEHRHSPEPGHRVAHCHKGDYFITAPRRKPLPFRKVWDRDGWKCVTCGTHKNLTVDHIIPVSKGGTDDLDNLQTMCGSCNSRKGNRT